MGRDTSGQAEKRKNILDATLAVISRETISGTRMNLIAKEAGVSQSILHYYFNSKQDILVGLLQELKQEFNIKRTGNIDPVRKPLEDNIQGFLDQKKDIILAHREMDIAQFDFFVQSLVDEDLKEVFRDFFRAWVDEIREAIWQSDLADETKERHAQSMPPVLLSLMMGASMQYLLWPDEFDLDAYFEEAKAMYLNHLRSGMRPE